ncbi:MAG: hypothetical protein HOV79_19945 [Hamadaea sp.]|nr:hypothetical protein [Hamadaea sp.]
MVGSAVAAATILTAVPAAAHECVNASKKQTAGVQVVIDVNTGQAVWFSHGLQQRIDRGLVDPDTGEGFRGLVGFDLNGDGVTDVSTYIVGPEMEIPQQAQFNGPACHGVTNVGVFFQRVPDLRAPASIRPRFAPSPASRGHRRANTAITTARALRQYARSWSTGA